MVSSTHYEIAIIGGGMIGTALARILGRQGRNVALVEAHSPRPWTKDSDYDLRVSAINRASQHLFEAMDAWEGILSRRVSPYARMHVWEGTGQGSITFDAAEIGEANLGHIIENRVIQEGLSEGLENVTQYCPNTLDSMHVGNDQVQLSLSDGTQLTSNLVVGADGAHSQVRQLAGIDREIRPYHQKAIVAVLNTELGHRDTAWQRFLATGPLALLPLSDGRCSLVWSADTAIADRLIKLPDEVFRSELSRATQLRLGCVTQIGPRATFPLIGGRVRPYVRPRVALIGDAAHTIHPLAGQGANLGFMDVAALAEVLGSTKRDVGSLRVLRAYERRRRADNEAIMKVIEGFKWLFGSQLPAIAWIRGRGLTLADTIGPLKRQLASRALMGS
ncbi:UbiH/UbiF/VisC/COQ6 family ubiquinone biosynthesis hydroxylase, partial [Acidihalobacter prosperus]